MSEVLGDRVVFWGRTSYSDPGSLALHHDLKKQRVVVYPPNRVLELDAAEARELGWELLDLARQIDGKEATE